MIDKDKKAVRIRNILLIVGVVFMCIGVLRGEQAIVLKKAVNICLECIGIG
jgi:hypothetical protein